MGSHVLGQFVDSSREQRDLHLGRAAIVLVPTELADEFGLPLLRDRRLPVSANSKRRTPAISLRNDVSYTHSSVFMQSTIRRPDGKGAKMSNEQ